MLLDTVDVGELSDTVVVTVVTVVNTLELEDVLLAGFAAQSMTAVYVVLPWRVTYRQNCVLPVSTQWLK